MNTADMIEDDAAAAIALVEDGDLHGASELLAKLAQSLRAEAIAQDEREIAEAWRVPRIVWDLEFTGSYAR